MTSLSSNVILDSKLNYETNRRRNLSPSIRGKTVTILSTVENSKICGYSVGL